MSYDNWLTTPPDNPDLIITKTGPDTWTVEDPAEIIDHDDDGKPIYVWWEVMLWESDEDGFPGGEVISSSRYTSLAEEKDLTDFLEGKA